MKKNMTQYTTVGSSALKSEPLEHVIEFPSRYFNEVHGQHVKEDENIKLFSHAKSLILKTQSVQDFRHGSLRGRSTQRVKPWQSGLATVSFFLVAMACVYFGA